MATIGNGMLDVNCAVSDTDLISRQLQDLVQAYREHQTHDSEASQRKVVRVLEALDCNARGLSQRIGQMLADMKGGAA